LDAGPRLVEKLDSIPDHRSAAIVHRISKEELAHVAVGTPLSHKEVPRVIGGDRFPAWLVIKS
jgi:uncharacterized ferritin-like protein (DUF455 family)